MKTKVAILSIASWGFAVGGFFYVDWRLGVGLISYSLFVNAENVLQSAELEAEWSRLIRHITGA